MVLKSVLSIKFKSENTKYNWIWHRKDGVILAKISNIISCNILIINEL